VELKLRKVGNSLALIVPKRVRENMGVADGTLSEEELTLWIRENIKPI